MTSAAFRTGTRLGSAGKEPGSPPSQHSCSSHRAAQEAAVHEVLTVEELGTVLGVWAHPEDEAYLSAGLMARARAAGQQVVVATATDGAGDLPGAGSLRRDELARSLSALGVTDVRWLGFPGGRCADVDPASGEAAVRRLLQEVRPDTVLSFGAGGVTGQADESAVAGWVAQAWRADGGRCRLLQATLTEGFHRRWGRLCVRTGVWAPDAVPPAAPDSDVALRVAVHGHAGHRKLAALRAHGSQTARLRAALGDETLLNWWAEETFVLVPGTGERAA
jgi:LmbE family N-acetylglucosaminyl deacetylase